MSARVQWRIQKQFSLFYERVAVEAGGASLVPVPKHLAYGQKVANSCVPLLLLYTTVVSTVPDRTLSLNSELSGERSTPTPSASVEHTRTTTSRPHIKHVTDGNLHVHVCAIRMQHVRRQPSG